MDPDVRKYFIKILNSFVIGLLWMLAVSTFGLYFGWALFEEGSRGHNIIFYTFFGLSFLFLIRYYYKSWK